MRSSNYMNGAAKRVAVAMSGGIDSSVSALLLKQQGFDVTGIFMRNWDQSNEADEGSSTNSSVCTTSSDRMHMKQVCQRLGIPDYEVDFVKDYWNYVFEPFLDKCSQRLVTPNPDVYCNRFVKFKKFNEFVREKFEIDTIATGHYARMHFHVLPDGKRVPQLLRGVDDSKDQSYFLSLTEGANLANVLFPVGEIQKRRVREIAALEFAGLDVLQKPESVGICFIGKRSFPQFISKYISLTPGRLIDIDNGKQMGVHNGIEAITVGQKARIRDQSEKYYVVSKSPRHGAALASKMVNSPTLSKGHVKEPAIDKKEATFRTRPRKVNRNSSDLSDIDYVSNYKYQEGDIFVCKGPEHPTRFALTASVDVAEFNWISGEPPAAILMATNGQAEATPFLCTCRARYRQEAVACSVSMQPIAGSSEEDAKAHSGWRLLISFVKPEIDVCPGQILALYDGDVCLGGGPIADTVIQQMG